MSTISRFSFSSGVGEMENGTSFSFLYSKLQRGTLWNERELEKATEWWSDAVKWLATHIHLSDSLLHLSTCLILVNISDFFFSSSITFLVPKDTILFRFTLTILQMWGCTIKRIITTIKILWLIKSHNMHAYIQSNASCSQVKFLTLHRCLFAAPRWW